MNITKILATSFAVASIATASVAGNPEPIDEIEPTIEVADEPSSSAGSGGYILPLLALVAVAALIADDGT